MNILLMIENLIIHVNSTDITSKAQSTTLYNKKIKLLKKHFKINPKIIKNISVFAVESDNQQQQEKH